MNKIQIVALVLLLAGIAPSCPFAGDNSTCMINGNCTGNCSENCGENCAFPNDAACAQNNSSEENCSALGSCPVKAASGR